jgi:acyl carrier protein
LKSVPGVAGKIEEQKTFMDYGANSLDIVEIVSGSMRELKVKIPRTELSDIKNIAGLVDKFVANAK